MNSGTLYVVGTPIGNMEDITLRALSTLKNVNRIVAEDTRVTKKLLSRHNINAPLTSLHARSTRAAFTKIVEMIEAGENIALVTDAGTPGISDPGAFLVALVRERLGEKAIVPIPRVSAVTTALSAAGIPADDFLFLGFLPHKKGRQILLKEIETTKRPVVLFESPHRIEKLIEELNQRVPEMKVIIARELTKLYEQVAAGTVAEIQERIEKEHLPNGQADIPARGEFVVILAG